MRWKECMEEEAVLFEDVLCQISDMIGPEVETLCLMILWLLYAQAILVFKVNYRRVSVSEAI